MTIRIEGCQSCTASQTKTGSTKLAVASGMPPHHRVPSGPSAGSALAGTTTSSARWIAHRRATLDPGDQGLLVLVRDVALAFELALMLAGRTPRRHRTVLQLPRDPRSPPLRLLVREDRERCDHTAERQRILPVALRAVAREGLSGLTVARRHLTAGGGADAGIRNDALGGSLATPNTATAASAGAIRMPIPTIVSIRMFESPARRESWNTTTAAAP